MAYTIQPRFMGNAEICNCIIALMKLPLEKLRVRQRVITEKQVQAANKYDENACANLDILLKMTDCAISMQTFGEAMYFDVTLPPKLAQKMEQKKREAEMHRQRTRKAIDAVFED